MSGATEKVPNNGKVTFKNCMISPSNIGNLVQLRVFLWIDHSEYGKLFNGWNMGPNVVWPEVNMNKRIHIPLQFSCWKSDWCYDFSKDECSTFDLCAVVPKRERVIKYDDSWTATKSWEARDLSILWGSIFILLGVQSKCGKLFEDIEAILWRHNK